MTGDNKNFERDNATGKNHEGRRANSPVKVLTATSIIGDNVENVQGEKLGDIKDIMINVNEGSIEYIILQSGGFLGIGDKLFAVPFNSLSLNPEKEVFVLNKDAAYIKNAPGFDQEHWPETNDHLSDVDTYWGQERTVTSATPEYAGRTGGLTSTGSIDPANFGSSGGATTLNI